MFLGSKNVEWNQERTRKYDYFIGFMLLVVILFIYMTSSQLESLAALQKIHKLCFNHAALLCHIPPTYVQKPLLPRAVSIHNWWILDAGQQRPGISNNSSPVIGPSSLIPCLTLQTPLRVKLLQVTPVIDDMWAELLLLLLLLQAIMVWLVWLILQKFNKGQDLASGHVKDDMTASYEQNRF